MADMFNTELNTDPNSGETLQEKAKKTGQKIVLNAQNNPDAVPSLKTSGQYLSELKELTENEELMRGAPDSSRKSLEEAIRLAREKYDKKASQNEWLEVAQMVGHAIAQLGAARVGGDRYDMTNIPTAKIDYQNRTDRAFKEYQGTVDMERGFQKDREAEFEEGAKQRKDKYDRSRDYLGEALRAARENEDRLSREKRDREKDEDDNKKHDFTLAKMNLAELNRQESELMKQLKARQTLINQLEQEEDLSPKSKKKIEEKYGQLAAQGDVDLATLTTELEETNTPKKLGGLMGNNPDPAKRKPILDGKVQEVKDMLAAIKKRKEELLRAQPKAAEGQAVTQADAKTLTPTELQAYAQQHNISVPDAQKFLESQGYVIK